ncbi:hypothetical protein NEFER03_1652 [Nematocida sp. LUAm3]|nr:hypothetical protein NEFER03_1652 [Nematocida sp. LUAm3]KAI5174676.1 hypothetical protein NEFER02_0786 [Nematocida sp. LUAm2]KAI5177914.1 hypothetical protein NEFER01_1116 [Nematocida sp. LUAm1]
MEETLQADEILNQEMILKALKRDQSKVLNPQSTPFLSVKNAYDSLLPYHIFLSPTYDDLIFTSVIRPIEEKNMNNIIADIGNILFEQESFLEELAVMEERLRVEEERYYLNKTINYKNTKIKKIEEQIINQ